MTIDTSFLEKRKEDIQADDADELTNVIVPLCTDAMYNMSPPQVIGMLDNIKLALQLTYCLEQDAPD